MILMLLHVEVESLEAGAVIDKFDFEIRTAALLYKNTAYRLQRP